MEARKQKRIRRHLRLRNQVRGTAERPRAAVFRSHQHIYAQLIDDETGHTLGSASDAMLPATALKEKNKSEVAYLVGKLLGEHARKGGISYIVFDRGGFAYHGRVREVARGMREAGLEF
jgi:large subunit ribosomal protein L18